MKKAYDPLQDAQYMSARMKKHFEKLLKQQLEEARKQEKMAFLNLQALHEQESDVIDRGAVTSTITHEAAIYERYQQQAKSLDAALRRLRDGYYGYCLETGEEIGVKRLLLVPYTTLCVEAQEKQESKGRGRQCPVDISRVLK